MPLCTYRGGSSCSYGGQWGSITNRVCLRTDGYPCGNRKYVDGEERPPYPPTVTIQDFPYFCGGKVIVNWIGGKYTESNKKLLPKLIREMYGTRRLAFVVLDKPRKELFEQTLFDEGFKLIDYGVNPNSNNEVWTYMLVVPEWRG